MQIVNQLINNNILCLHFRIMHFINVNDSIQVGSISVAIAFFLKLYGVCIALPGTLTTLPGPPPEKNFKIQNVHVQ